MPNTMNGTLGILITVFILIVLGIQLLNITADNNQKMGALTTVTGDAFTGSNTTCVKVTAGCIESITWVKNTSATPKLLNSGNYTLCTASGGSTGQYNGITLLDKYYIANPLNTTYIESPDCTYVKNGTARSLAGLVVLFFAIGILGLGIFIVMKSDLMDYFK